MHENRMGDLIIEAAIEVHRELGPGLLESVYEVALAHEITERGLALERQVPISCTYKTFKLENGFVSDIIVENAVILELKSVQSVMPVHKKQLLTYLRLADLRLGYLLNFGEYLMKTGITRIVNSLEPPNS